MILISPQLGMREVAADLRRTLPRRARDLRYSEAVAKWNAGRVARTDVALGSWLRSVFDLYFDDPGIGREWWPRLHFDEISAVAWLNVTASNAYYEVRQRLAELTVPMLILVGRHDFITSPAQSYLIKRAYRPAKLCILQRSGHFPWLEEPRMVFGAMASFIGTLTKECPELEET
jgi:pimeloyl-ACP methyl ester carboxylesterase